MAQARIEIVLRWRDMDMLGHLNQAVYHEMLEEARGALIASVGDNRHFTFVLARVELDYRHEVRKDHGRVVIDTRVAGVGRTSVTIDHEVTLPDGTLAASGRSVLVAWDPAARGSRELSDAERAALTV